MPATAIRTCKTYRRAFGDARSGTILDIIELVLTDVLRGTVHDEGHR